MLLLTSLRVTKPTAPSGGSWFITEAPPGIVKLRVNSTCGDYTLGSQVGSTDNPTVTYNCPSNAGIYKFEYRVTYCETLVTYKLIVNVTSEFSASIEEVYSGTPCAVNAVIIDPSTSEQSLQLVWGTDDFVPNINGRLLITDGCGNPPITTSFSVPAPTLTKVYTYLTIPIINYGGYIKTIKFKNSANTFVIDVSPTSPYLSYVGSPYTVTGTDLYFTVYQTNFIAYQTALLRVVLNAIHSLTGEQSNMCPFGVSAPLGTNLVLNFFSKNQPSAEYTGIDHLDAQVITNQSGVDVTSFSGVAPRRLWRSSDPLTISGTTACGKEISISNTLITNPDACDPNLFRYLDLPANGSPYSFNVNYNVIDFGTFRLDTSACSATGDFTCAGASLTLKAVSSPTCPNATYLWNTAATTQTIVPSTGTYSVTITCDTCSDTASITI